MLTKTQVRILEVFVAKLTKKFSIRGVAKEIEKPYALVHKSIMPLVKDGIVIKDEHGLLFVNYKENYSELGYIEAVRRAKLFSKNKIIKIFMHDLLSALKLDFFTVLVFGSVLKKQSPKDIDVLIVVEDKTDIAEKTARGVALRFKTNFDINVISSLSAHEMLAKRDEPNLINETLDNHIIVFGAENYYRMVANGR